ncbi:MAG: hypothetical protein R2762_11580 [Bryobacteraceae bacterium]
MKTSLAKLAIWFPAVLLAAGAPVVPAGAVTDLAAGSRESTPGGLIRIAGEDLAPGETRAASLPLPETIEGVTVEVDDGTGPRNAPLFAVSPRSIEAQLPYSLTGESVRVRVKNAGGESDARDLPLAAASPRLLAAGAQVLVTLADGTPGAVDQPAEAGSSVTFYATGLGPVDPPRPAGEPGGTGAGDDPLNWTTLPVQMLIGGLEAPITFVGLMPGAAGVYQINCTLSGELVTGVHEARLLADGRASQPGLLLAVANMAAPRREFFAAPTGTSDGDGSRDRPWDLTTALKQPAAVRPGDIIWLRGGSYGDGKTRFESSLAGAPGKPIVVRQALGERATIQGGMRVEGHHAWYWGFEVTNRFNSDRRTENVPYSFDIFGPDTKFINLVVHDTGQGFGLWTPAVNAELYGSLTFYNGFLLSDRGHGHGIYTQNQEGTKLLHDNIFFDQFSVGIHAYGSEKAFVEGYDVRGNIVFENGYLAGGPSAFTDNILFAVGKPIDRITLEDNFTYNRPEDNAGYSRIGWFFGPGPNGTASIRNNHFIGGQFPVELGYWNRLTFTGNVTYSENAFNVRLDTQEGQNAAGYAWDSNTHYGPQRFLVQSKSAGSEEWRAQGVDRNSRFLPQRPEGVWSFVRPNKYEPGRANIVIYNWDKKETVEVDVSKAIKPGTRYQLRDAMDFYGTPVLAGTYEGGPLTVPMKERVPMRPVGDNLPVLPRHTLPQFGVFILLPAE